MDSSFALQQYIQLKIKQNPAAIEEILQLPQNQEEDVWQYEHLRFSQLICVDIYWERMICLELHNFIVLLQETECTPEKCPEMKADEWLYLCAAHQTPLNVVNLNPTV